LINANTWSSLILQHFLNQQRKIKPEWIRAAIENPDKTENDAADHTLAHALKAIPEKGFKILRVVYNETTEPVTIITAYFD
jgi:hypothetical protein